MQMKTNSPEEQDNSSIGVIILSLANLNTKGCRYSTKALTDYKSGAQTQNKPLQAFVGNANISLPIPLN
ncbi:hypothetical protein JTB14_021386 [Gonioctena quinquepunctata]|nr:hypothetical protein JTB14_021386 [Gonioctena quinquepunctata]